jgi:hypothetical protein
MIGRQRYHILIAIGSNAAGKSAFIRDTIYTILPLENGWGDGPTDGTASLVAGLVRHLPGHGP